MLRAQGVNRAPSATNSPSNPRVCKTKNPIRKISLEVLEPIWAEKGIRLDGVTVVEGVLDQPESLALR